jgi:myo-inositol 2-dehydrogenase/D-chiro-inositol 1-dehydrogenase
MTELGVGIIGLGRMGWLHAEHLRGAIRGARLVAAAVDETHRRHLEVTGEAPCELVADVGVLVADPRIDAVVVVSPTSLHHEHIRLAAEAGKAIFAEKPLADSVDRSRETAAALRRSGVPFQIGFQRRFDPGYARARELIDAGTIGTVEMFRGLTCDVMPPVAYLRTSGGLFWDLGIHDFDAARFLMNDDVVEVTATGAILIEPELAEFDDVDHGVVVLRFRRGGLGVVQNAWRAPYGYDIRAEVHGSRGKIVTDLDERVPTRLYGPTGFSSERHFLFVERFAEAYCLELQAFVDAVLAGGAPTPGIDDALQAVLVADAATRSRRTGARVEVDSTSG